MKNFSRAVLAGALLSAILLGLHALYFASKQVAISDSIVWVATVAGWTYFMRQVRNSRENSQRNLRGLGSNTGRFVRESSAFHAQLGSEIAEQLTSANTELGNTQVILNEAITKLVGNFITISDEVRNLAASTDTFSKQMHELVNTVNKSLRIAERFLDGLGSNDPVVVRESEAHLHAMIDSISAFNDTVTQNAVELNLISGKVEQNVLVVISSLQFQDMSSQLIEHARMRMSALQEVANEMAKQGDILNNRQYLERIAAYNRLLDKHVASLDKQKSNPVAHKDYSGGDVELF